MGVPTQPDEDETRSGAAALPDLSWDDSPLDEPDDDTLGRAGFAASLADALAGLTTKESVVVGLHGRWGSGKSTILNFVEHYLSTEADVTVVRFNPWMIGTEESALVHEFIITLGTALDDEFGPKKSKFLALAQSASPVLKLASLLPVVGNAAKVASDSLDAYSGTFEASIGEFREELERTLGDEKSVLVIVDDLDRLSVAQLATMFRLVKSVGVFKRTRYLLAFDRNVVASALDESFAGGREFVGKIIQVQVDVPEAAPEAILATFDSEVASMRENSGQEVDADWVLRQHALGEYLQEHVINVRDAKRLSYAVDFAAAAAGHRLDLLDVAGLAALRLHSSEVADRLASIHPSDFASLPDAERYVPDSENGRDRTIQLVRSILRIDDAQDGSRPIRLAEKSGRDMFFTSRPDAVSEADILRWVEFLFTVQAPVPFERWMVTLSKKDAERMSQVVTERLNQDRSETNCLLLALTSGAWCSADLDQSLAFALAKGPYSRAMFQQIDLRAYLAVARAIDNDSNSWGHDRYIRGEQAAERNELLDARLAELEDPPVFPGDQRVNGTRRSLFERYLETVKEGAVTVGINVEASAEAFLDVIKLYHSYYSDSVDVAALADALGNDQLRTMVESHRSVRSDLVDKFRAQALRHLQEAERPTAERDAPA